MDDQEIVIADGAIMECPLEQEIAAVPEPAKPAPKSLDQFCRDHSRDVHCPELLAGFFHVEEAAGRHTDVATHESWRDRLEAFGRKPARVEPAPTVNRAVRKKGR